MASRRPSTAARADELLLGFARALRAAGVPVTAGPDPGLPRGARRSSGSTTSGRRYWAGRATLCSRPGRPRPLRPGVHRLVHRRTCPRGRPPEDQRADRAQAAARRRATAGRRRPTRTPLNAMASEAEVLRHRDIADMAAAEKARLAVLFETLRRAPPVRTAHRRSAWHRGDVDAAAHAAADAARGWGSPARSPTGAARPRPAPGGAAARRLRLDERLRRRAAAAGPPVQPLPATRGGRDVEVFTIGTRLTRVTRAMRMRDPERAIVAAGETVPGLVRRHPARRDAADLPGPLGAARAGPRRGRRGVQRRLGARRRGPARRADAPAAPDRPPGGVGEPARGQGRLPAGAAGNRGGPAVR